MAQQKLGRVRPTRSIYGVMINDEPRLEREADAMGERASRIGRYRPGGAPWCPEASSGLRQPSTSTVQRVPKNVWTAQERDGILEVLQAEDSSGEEVSARDKADVLERSAAQVFWYGREAKTDEQVEITAGASYLDKRNRDWRQEVQRRQQYFAPRRTTWEGFQGQIAALTPPGAGDREPWFMQPGIGFQLQPNFFGPGRTQNEQFLHTAGVERATDRYATAQSALGYTYDRDSAFVWNQNWDAYHTAIDSHSDDRDFQHKKIFSFWKADRSKELRLDISQAHHDQTYDFIVTGAVLKGLGGRSGD